jgi:hypothetical protein
MNKQSTNVRTYTAHFIVPINVEMVSVFLIALGAIMIWLAPSLYGLGVLNVSWCLSAHPTLMTQATNLTAQILEHCPFCYFGAGLIGAGLTTLSFGQKQRHV